MIVLVSPAPSCCFCVSMTLKRLRLSILNISVYSYQNPSISRLKCNIMYI